MREKDRLILLQLKNKLQKEVNLNEIRVFGSRADNSFREDSDIDVYVQVDTITSEVKEIIRDICWQVSYENRVVITPLIFSRDEVENSPLKSSPIIKNIYADGIAI